MHLLTPNALSRFRILRSSKVSLTMFLCFIKVRFDQRIGEDNDYYTNAGANGANSGATSTYTATKKFQQNPNFFNDIFNVGFKLSFCL